MALTSPLTNTNPYAAKMVFLNFLLHRCSSTPSPPSESVKSQKRQHMNVMRASAMGGRPQGTSAPPEPLDRDKAHQLKAQLAQKLEASKISSMQAQISIQSTTASEAVKKAQYEVCDAHFSAWKAIHSDLSGDAFWKTLQATNPDYVKRLTPRERASITEMTQDASIMHQQLLSSAVTSVVLGARGVAQGSIPIADQQYILFLDAYAHAFPHLVYTQHEGRVTFFNTHVLTALGKEGYPNKSLSELMELFQTDDPQIKLSKSDKKRIIFKGKAYGLPFEWVNDYIKSYSLNLQLVDKAVDREGIQQFFGKVATQDLQNPAVLKATLKQLRSFSPDRYVEHSDETLTSLLNNCSRLHILQTPACLKEEAATPRRFDGPFEWFGRRPFGVAPNRYFSDATQVICDKAKGMIRDIVSTRS